MFSHGSALRHDSPQLRLQAVSHVTVGIISLPKHMTGSTDVCSIYSTLSIQYCAVLVSSAQLDETNSAPYHPTVTLLLCHYEFFPTFAHSARFICTSSICRSQDHLSNWNGVICKVESPCRDHLSWPHRSRLCLNNDWGVRMLSPKLICDILSYFS